MKVSYFTKNLKNSVIFICFMLFPGSCASCQNFKVGYFWFNNKKDLLKTFCIVKPIRNFRVSLESPLEEKLKNVKKKHMLNQWVNQSGYKWRNFKSPWFSKVLQGRKNTFRT